MYDDLTTLSNDPSESGQESDSALFRYLSVLGSANRFRQQLQDQYLPQDASLPDFLNQVRGAPSEDPKSDALQRLSGLFRIEPSSTNKSHNPAFPWTTMSGTPTQNGSYNPYPYRAGTSQTDKSTLQPP